MNYSRDLPPFVPLKQLRGMRG